MKLPERLKNFKPKEILKNLWGGLPVVSLLKYTNQEDDSIATRTGKLLGNVIYAAIPAVYLGMSLNYGSLNLSEWNDIIEKRRMEDIEYSRLYYRAVGCVDRDFLEGLTLSELDELYDRAGVVIEFNPATGEFKLPKLTKENLESAVNSCGVF